MAFIQKLMNSASGVAAQGKAAARQAAREVQLPALILEKAATLQKLDKELGSLGWSPTPEVKARKAQLTQERKQVGQELAGPQQELKANQERARDAQRNRLNMLR